MKTEMISAYLEKILEDWTGSDKLTTDADGDYTIPFGKSLVFTRVRGSQDRPTVTAMSVAVTEIEQTPDLLIELNNINSKLMFVRTYWSENRVIFDGEITANAIDPEEVTTLVGWVGNNANDVADTLIAKFGGQRPFQDRFKNSGPADPDKPSDDNRTGLYL